ncbi:MAG: hypothetical protein LBU73_07280 [Helicobacteraceae bacterium]|nr:hypothetical protein [Helicobacteraceae bacterium]
MIARVRNAVIALPLRSPVECAIAPLCHYVSRPPRSCRNSVAKTQNQPASLVIAAKPKFRNFHSDLDRGLNSQ